MDADAEKTGFYPVFLHPNPSGSNRFDLRFEPGLVCRLRNYEVIFVMPTQVNTAAFTVFSFGTPEADTLLVQMVDDHDLEVIESEVSYIRELSGGQAFSLMAVKVNSWNNDLSPWSAPAVFGNEGFGNGAGETLNYLLENILPDQKETNRQTTKRIYIGGYSLAGLFALWAGCQTDRFDGIAAASPSVWFPNFTGYMQDHKLHTDTIYLSLGDKEERTRHPVMSQAGNAIREVYALLTDYGKNCVLEWNKGNHFRDPDLRTAKAFAWVMTCHDDHGWTYTPEE